MTSKIRDFTKAQAKRWVEQEFNKYRGKDAEAIRERIRSEEAVEAFYAKQPGFKPSLPNSTWAHEELLRQLKAI